jgi:hypothetical protein
VQLSGFFHSFFEVMVWMMRGTELYLPLSGGFFFAACVLACLASVCLVSIWTLVPPSLWAGFAFELYQTRKQLYINIMSNFLLEKNISEQKDYLG